MFGHYLIAAESLLYLVNIFRFFPSCFMLDLEAPSLLYIPHIPAAKSLLINIFKFGFCCLLLRTLTCTVSIVISLRVHFRFF